jgi:murein DD-endopeptidase MepM/ murein hydrolase activator NlpD
MRLVLLLLLTFSSLSSLVMAECDCENTVKKPAVIAPSANKEIKPATIGVSDKKLAIDKTEVEQGQFFTVDILGFNTQPKLWFNTKQYPPFKVSDKHYRSLVPVENLTKPGEYAILARNGQWEQKVKVKVKDNHKKIQYITLSSSKSGLQATPRELNEISTALRTMSETLYANDNFMYPSSAAKSSPFGVKRSYNRAPVSSYHKGLDFAGAMGSPVFAPASGRVALTGYEKNGYNIHGNAIVLDHGHAVTSIYMHLSKIDVKQGEVVKKGQKIGEVGHTGISTGPHLHWGTYLYGTSIDPELLVKK